MNYLKINLSTFKWGLLVNLVSLFSGSASALFLFLLDLIGTVRESNNYLLFTLPISGVFIVWLYNQFGQTVQKGNNQIISEINNPLEVISWKMSPLILISTLLTHLSGGSAGREGTAVQMSAGLNDWLSNILYLNKEDRPYLLRMTVAAGFASVFGTPLAGTIFAFEFSKIGKFNLKYVLPILISSFGADFVTQHLWQQAHTQYFVYDIPTFGLKEFLFCSIAGLIMGICAFFYSFISELIQKKSKEIIQNPYSRIVAGSLILILIFSTLHYLLKDDRFQGLGVEYIVKAFSQKADYYTFILKLLLTAFTLGIGFKGGEVTPLFYIGATLGSFLSIFIALPTALLAGMGFVAVFAGCARTPIACIIMGIELFGAATIPYLSIACILAFQVAKSKGIYIQKKEA